MLFDQLLPEDLETHRNALRGLLAPLVLHQVPMICSLPMATQVTEI